MGRRRGRTIFLEKGYEFGWVDVLGVGMCAWCNFAEDVFGGQDCERVGERCTRNC